MIDQNSHLPDPHLDAQFYAGVPFKRLIAWGVDILAVLGICIGLILATFGILAFIFPVIAFLANLGYRIFCLNKWSATLGMRLTGIEIRNRMGERLSQSDAIWHTAIFVFVFMSGLGIFANILAIMLTERGQGLHDLLLGSTAINRPTD